MKNRNVGLFCAASESIDSVYVDAARDFGRWLGQGGRTLVYGGASKGLMETTAATVKASGGHVVGVVPEILITRGFVSTLLDEQVTVADLSARKNTILSRSDILVALPGGVGTLDEVFHVMAAATIGYHDKKVVFYNVDGFWQGMLELLDDYARKGFLRGEPARYYAVANNLDELINIIDEK